jgi:homocysteine S-methyltransferase
VTTADRREALARLTDPTHIVLFDGAMGTELYARGVFINQCYDELNLRAPEMVRAVHAAYAAAGAEVLETNTFGANRLKLAQFGLEAQVEAINRRGAELAREAADADPRGRREGAAPVLVAGAVGPLGVRIEPYGPTSRDEARALFREQIAALRAGGADCVILETFGDLIEIEQAIRAAREVDAAMPVIAQMTVGVDLRTPYGATPADVARALDGWGADVVGLNCSVGPQTILEAVEQMAAATRRKLSAMPNAGMPREVNGRQLYMASAEYFATYARHLVQGGSRVVGGCCGTTPEHVRAMRQSLRVERAMGRSEGERAAAAAGPEPGSAAEHAAAAPAAPRGSPRPRWASGRGSAPSWPRARSSRPWRSCPRAGSTPPSCSPTPPCCTARAWTPSTCPTGRARRAAWAPSPRHCSSSSGWGSRR